MADPFRIGYFGDGPWAHLAFEKLVQQSDIVIGFVCVRHDKPDSHLVDLASKHNIPAISHQSVNSKDFASRYLRTPYSLFVSMSFNQIFRSPLISFPAKTTVNCHAGKLPFYRGRNILNWVLINDESEFGITVHYMDSGIDTGDIILQSSYPITDDDDYKTLLSRAYGACASLLCEAVRQIIDGTASRTPQAEIHGTGLYCSPRKEGDEVLNWNQTSRDVFNFVRALCKPGPQARTTCEGLPVAIERVEMINAMPTYKGIPGSILYIDDGDLVVKTSDTAVRVTDFCSEKSFRPGDRMT